MYPKRCNTINQLQEQDKYMTFNCRSVVTKDVTVGQYLREEKMDLALLTETWYSDDKQHQFETSDVNRFGYKLSVMNRKNRIGGEIALAYRNVINVTKVSSGSPICFDYGIWE